MNHDLTKGERVRILLDYGIEVDISIIQISCQEIPGWMLIL